MIIQRRLFQILFGVSLLYLNTFGRVVVVELFDDADPA